MWLQNKWNSVNIIKWNYLLQIQLMIMISFASAILIMPAERTQLVVDDNNTLLSPEFLPFLEECSGQKPNVRLCSMYFDTVYNVYRHGQKWRDDVKMAMIDASKKLENSELTDKFCNILQNESSMALDAQPFSKANHFDAFKWIKESLVCQVNCLDNSESEASHLLRVKEVCKFISGGCRWIVAQKKNLASNVEPIVAEPDAPVAQAVPVAPVAQVIVPKLDKGVVFTADKKQDTETIEEVKEQKLQSIPGIATNSTIPKTVKTSTKPSQEAPDLKQVNNSVPPVPIPPKSKDSSSVTPKLNKSSSVAQDTHNNDIDINQQIKNPINDQSNKAISTNIPNEDENSYPNNEQKTELNNELKSNEMETDDQDADDSHENESEFQSEFKSNNNNNIHDDQSAQKAQYLGGPQFRQDKESNFFPYFMFLMFIVVSFYVAYHNKSKILALLIEGRRSRSYSSRGNGRRKQHSAEYRKLDSNLEEAIQSEGGHVLSTQIIY